MIEAMKQALKKIRAAQQCHPNAVMVLLCEADEVLDQAITEAEKQEPVIGVEVKRIASGGFIGNVWWIHENLQEGVFHLYTHPQPKREPLTDEQIAEISVECATVTPSDIYFARAIEAVHGIKGEA